MLGLKSIKVKKSVTNVVINLDDTSTLEQTMALSLLLGNYNSLRKASEDNTPIDLEKLEAFRLSFSSLLSNVASEMSINLDDIEKLSS